MSHVQTDVLDVVIIGGGLVGGLTALLLAQGGVQATVLDAAPILDEQKLKCCKPTCFGTQSSDDTPA
jgi:2-polyprenyl-6-methoxyphenol hydroxylase-like FAD-dependent oxidoreductase